MQAKAFEIAGLPRDEVSRFVAGLHSDPFGVLGPHKVGDDLEIRIFRPDARAIEVVLDQDPDNPVAAQRIDEEGFFCSGVTGAERDVEYHLRIVKQDGSEELMRDPYQFGPVMGDIDLHLFREGQHWKIYDKFGAHLRTIGDAAGVYFAVWAPNAQRVSVVGDFNDWDGRRHPMRCRGTSGIWELFIPGLGAGHAYKYEILSRHGQLVKKTDPYARQMFLRPETTSCVPDDESYTWQDGGWIEARARFDWQHSPISIYELHPGSWRRHADGRFGPFQPLLQVRPRLGAELRRRHVTLGIEARHAAQLLPEPRNVDRLHPRRLDGPRHRQVLPFELHRRLLAQPRSLSQNHQRCPSGSTAR